MKSDEDFFPLLYQREAGRVNQEVFFPSLPKMMFYNGHWISFSLLTPYSSALGILIYIKCYMRFPVYLAVLGYRSNQAGTIGQCVLEHLFISNKLNFLWILSIIYETTHLTVYESGLELFVNYTFSKSWLIKYRGSLYEIKLLHSNRKSII